MILSAALPGKTGGAVEVHASSEVLTPERAECVPALRFLVDALLDLGLPLNAAAVSAAIPAALRSPVPAMPVPGLSIRAIAARKAHFSQLKRETRSQARPGSRIVSACSVLSADAQIRNGLMKSKTSEDDGGGDVVAATGF